LRVNVVKGQCIIVFPDDFGRNLSRDDFFEDRHTMKRISDLSNSGNVANLAIIQLGSRAGLEVLQQKPPFGPWKNLYHICNMHLVTVTKSRL